MIIEKGGNSMVYIVGIGPGNTDYIIQKAKDVINSCHYVIGFERAIKSLESIKCNKVIVKSLKDTLDFLKENNKNNIAVAASGDPCFYGITDYIKKNYKGEIKVIPGISSFQYMSAKLSKPWQGAALCSAHGRKNQIIPTVKSNKLSIWLTDKVSTPNYICQQLIENKIEATVYIGENLSYKDEKIYIGKPEEITDITFTDLCVVIVEREGD